MILKMQVHK